MSLNIELLKMVRDKIATAPAAYEQGAWGKPSESAPCGTAACIAGWACVLSGAMSVDELLECAADRDWRRIEGEAAEQLGVTAEEADTLFDGDPACAWPKPFRAAWENADSDGENTSPEQALVAIAYLNNIIETGKVLE